jgi:hypothetical protein
MKPQRCPGCGKKVYHYEDFADHVECVVEWGKSKYDETARDDYPEPRERIA